jgi:hypothetical protein
LRALYQYFDLHAAKQAKPLTLSAARQALNLILMASSSGKEAMKAFEHDNEHEGTGIPCCPFDMEFSLPTGGVIVKGCLDECDVCEPHVKERLQLENDLLRRQIELLEKSQEYRCCPPAPVIND